MLTDCPHKVNPPQQCVSCLEGYGVECKVYARRLTWLSSALVASQGYWLMSSPPHPILASLTMAAFNLPDNLGADGKGSVEGGGRDLCVAFAASLIDPFVLFVFVSHQSSEGCWTVLVARSLCKSVLEHGTTWHPSVSMPGGLQPCVMDVWHSIK